MLATSVPGGCGASQEDAKVIGTWVPVEVPSEQWGTDFDPAKAAITFNDDGDWIASDGCNHNQGEYSIDGEEFTSPLASNLGGVGCPYGTVPYEELLAAADRLEATQKELRFYDGGHDDPASSAAGLVSAGAATQMRCSWCRG